MNLASFVTTWMEPEAAQLMNENINVNLADQNVYPQCTELQHRCVNMIAHLFHAGDINKDAIGSATIGSSEGLMLGLLAMLGKWRVRERKRTGRDPLDDVGVDGKIRKPNYIVSASSHGTSFLLFICLFSHFLTNRKNVKSHSHILLTPRCCIHINSVSTYACLVTVLKFGRYFNVETRVVPFEQGIRHLTVEAVLSRIDENTIGIVSVVGTQLTGEVDDVQKIHDAVADYCQNTKKWDFVVPIHVDAASGGKYTISHYYSVVFIGLDNS
jgi:glutamate decarboxylase